MFKIPVKILGTGIYLPSKLVMSEDLEKELGYSPGTFEKSSGVRKRHYAFEETASEMGAKAAEQALQTAKINKSKIDAIISVSGVPQQAIPTNAALIHKKLNLKKAIAFDINSTCTSFLTGFFCMSHLIAQGVYNHVLLVSSDIASVGLNPKDSKTVSLFGDGAAACILGRTKHQGIITSYFETNSEKIDCCQCLAGGNLFGLKNTFSQDEYYFQMNGPKLFKAVIPQLLQMLQQMINYSEKKINLYIPHQASPLALDLLQKKLKLPDSQFMHIVRDYGNMIATSIPFALHKAIESGKIQRTDRVLIFGTGAGLGIGGILLEY